MNTSTSQRLYVDQSEYVRQLIRLRLSTNQNMTLARDPKQYVIIDSWLWNPGCGCIWETSGRHLGRHLGGIWEASASIGGIRGHLRASGGTLSLTSSGGVAKRLQLQMSCPPSAWTNATACRRSEFNVFSLPSLNPPHLGVG